MNPNLDELVEQAKAKYEALTPLQKAYHDYEQRRSFAKGMCPSDYTYEEWCEIVDRIAPPAVRPR